MKKLTKLFIAFICVFCLQNCENDDFIPTTTPIDPEVASENLLDQEFRNANFGNVTTGNFIGTITDTSGSVLQNVQITIGNTVTMTDRNGLFVLNNVSVFENFAYIKATKDGYISGSRMVIPKTDGANSIQIILLKKEVTGTVNSGETSQVSLPSGASVTFNGDFITADGNAYNGAVDVVMHYLYPNNAGTFQVMPGALFAQDADNEARLLETYGMVSVNLFSPAGESLNIDPNSTATIEFPIYFSQSDSAPQTIKLWHFDEENGYWKEDGQATRDGNNYVGEVSHFTWWNCDVPLDLVEFCFTLTPTNSTQNAPYYTIIRRAADDNIIFLGIVNSNQIECGFIPRNEEVILEVYGGIDSEACNASLIHLETLGGYATDASANISFQEEFTITPITGTANNCAGNPITNGYVYINTVNVFSITNGTIDIGVQTCASVTETLALQIFDFDTDQWTIIENVSMDGNPINIGTISTCDDSGGIFNGDVVLATQQEVENFGGAQFTTINGNLTIGNPSPGSTISSDISDISSLSALETVTEIVTINYNENLQSLQGFENITALMNLIITNNNSLASLNGLNNLTSIEFLWLKNNSQLASIADLGNLNTLSSLRVEDNPVLASLQGLENITSIENGIILDNNDAITNILPLSNLTSLNGFYAIGNASLTSLEGLEQITELMFLWIYDNAALVSLDGLQNLAFMPVINNISIAIGTQPEDDGSFVPKPNENLVDFCALQNLFANGNGTQVEVRIENNPFNPTPQEIAAGNCSQ